MQHLKDSQKGSILFIVITFIFTSGILFLLILKVYMGSLSVIKEEKLNQRQFNNLLNPSDNLSDKIKVFPSNNKKHLDFNKILKDAKECKSTSYQSLLSTDFNFVSSKFCNISKLDANTYKGNITAKGSLKLKSPFLFATGSILINGTLVLTSNITYIYSFGDIKIDNLIGDDVNTVYFVFLESLGNKIEATSSLNVQIANDAQNVANIIFPTYKKNVLYVK